MDLLVLGRGRIAVSNDILRRASLTGYKLRIEFDLGAGERDGNGTRLFG